MSNFIAGAILMVLVHVTVVNTDRKPFKYLFAIYLSLSNESKTGRRHYKVKRTMYIKKRLSSFDWTWALWKNNIFTNLTKERNKYSNQNCVSNNSPQKFLSNKTTIKLLSHIFYYYFIIVIDTFHLSCF